MATNSRPSNPTPDITLVSRAPTRVKPHGKVTIAAGDVYDISGSDSRQERVAIVITVLDAVEYLEIQTPNGVTWSAAFAQLPWAMETPADIRLFNNNGSAVQVTIGEFYPDIGNQHGIPFKKTVAAPPSGGGTTGGTTGGTSSGGTSGGTSGGSSGGDTGGGTGHGTFLN